MPLEEIPLSLDIESIPQPVEDLIEEAERRADEFYEAGLGLRFPNYVPSDPRIVYAAMSDLKKQGHLQGKVFCEWGCGFGLAACMASMLGMKAYGLEIEDDLFARASKLAADLNLPVKILQTSYLPEGFDESEGHGGKDLISPDDRTTAGGLISPPMYDDLDPGDVDLFFVYPWPGQEEMMMDLFSAVASHGSILLIYLGDGEIEAYTLDDSGDSRW
ncbi:MAG: hypothetical protein KDK97_12275 [Verrucomicrobiales bacterium]|nr:hypothetical protein [Verrucomicrobiales bacterium]MCP5557323.1 hypothetical protein [Verrucomicrobiaceae bacterium]